MSKKYSLVDKDAVVEEIVIDKKAEDAELHFVEATLANDRFNGAKAMSVLLVATLSLLAATVLTNEFISDDFEDQQRRYLVDRQLEVIKGDNKKF